MEDSIKLAVILSSGPRHCCRFICREKNLERGKTPVFISGKFISLNIKGKKALVFTGRKHFYEGYSKSDILSNIRLTKQYGVKTALLSNAAGSLNENFEVPDTMLIS